MKIALLTNGSVQAEALMKVLENEGIHLTGILIEEKKSKAKMPAVKRINSLIKAALRPMFHYLKYNREERNVFRYEKRCEINAGKLLADYIQSLELSNSPSIAPKIKVNSVNSEDAINYLKSWSPDYVLVYGTGIIKPHVISLAKNGMINVHSSILPYYKGTRSEFWQCYNQDYRYVGISIHKVNEGVDTGEIYATIPQEIPLNPDPYKLRVGNVMLMLQHYPQIVKQIISGAIQCGPNHQPNHDKTYRMSDITLERRVELYKRLLKESN